MTTTPPPPPPVLDGGWSADPAALAAAADDFGHLAHRPPYAVARPRSAGDVAAVCRYAAETGRPVAAQGARHATSGAGQVAGGVVLDMTGLDRVGVPADGIVEVAAGARWSAVLDATLPYGLTPPTLTDYLETTVGGTLAVGGIGGGAHLHGPQIDTVAGLEVVTGGGRRLSGAAGRDAVGAGRDAVIVRASLALVAAPERVRLHRLTYDDPGAFVRDQLALCGDPRWCHLEGQAVSDDGVTWRYRLEAAHATGTGPDADAPGRPRGDAEITEVTEVTYRELAHRMAPSVPDLIASGDWYRPHPWFSAFVPATRVHAFLAAALPTLRPADLGPLPVLIYPLRRGPRPAPGLATPAEDVFFTVSVLRTCAEPDAAAAVADNARLLRLAARHGGVWYPVGVLPDDLTYA